jgi:hypothetical protein
VIALTSVLEDRLVVDAVQAGAMGYCSRIPVQRTWWKLHAATWRGAAPP